MIKQRVIKYLSRKKPQDQLQEGLTYSHAKKTAILFSEDQDNQALEELKRSLEQDGKDITTLMLVSKPEKEAEYSHLHFSEKDISLTGKIASSRLLAFFETQFDLLLVLDETHTNLTRFILSKSRAALRAGYYMENNENTLLNLVVRPTDRSHHAELLAYLRKIA